MASTTLEERVAELENRLGVIEQSQRQPGEMKSGKKGWRAIVGISANDPHFEEAVRLGREWRNADRPKDEHDQQTSGDE